MEVSKRGSHIAGGLVLLVVSSLVSLGLAEYVFRTVKEFEYRKSAKYWRHDLYAMLPDSPLEYALHPGVARENLIPDTGETWRYRINSDGFRGEDFHTGDNRRRVLFIGDSYTFGWGVNPEEVLTESVERELAQQPYRLEIDAYNLGVPGYNTFQEYHLLNQVVDRYTPDLVVLNYVMNDAEPQQNVPLRPSVRYKYVTSWLFSYIKKQINYHIYEDEPVLNTGVVDILKGYAVAMKDNGAEWVEARQAFYDMVALCRQRDIPFMVVVLPDYTQRFDGSYSLRVVHEEVLGWADANGVPAVDMFQYFQGKNHKKYWVEGDGHPNGKAFAEIAQALAPIIHEHLDSLTP